MSEKTMSTKNEMGHTNVPLKIRDIPIGEYFRLSGDKEGSWYGKRTKTGYNKQFGGRVNIATYPSAGANLAIIVTKPASVIEREQAEQAEKAKIKHDADALKACSSLAHPVEDLERVREILESIRTNYMGPDVDAKADEALAILEGRKGV